jgi:hypothetical protein
MITRQTLLLAAGIVALGAGAARAQDDQGYSAGVEITAEQGDPNAPPEPYGPPPIPPEAEAQVQTGPGNSVCFVGPHPVDTSVAGGSAWDDTQGAHYHFYGPFDLRLFRLEGGCYYFVGDPADFGYQGAVYSYYGAHPILNEYGGGWCFMVGGHRHWWRPWSASFVVMNNWYYWNGPYDSVFWTYWPYYSYYYRAYYPHYYGGGRWYRGYDRRVAPRIERVPPSYARGWTGGRPGRAPVAPVQGGGWRGGPPRMGQPAPVPRAAPQTHAGAVGGWSGSGAGWHGGAPAATPRQPMAPRPAAPAPSPSSGGWHGGAPMAPSSGGWHGGTPSAPSHPAPSSGGWHGGAPSAPSHPVSSSHPSVTPHSSGSAPSRAPSPSSSGGGWHGGSGRR